MNLYEKLNRLDDSLAESKRVVKKKNLAESTNRVKLEVKYETYGRYGDGGDIKTGRVSGSTEVEALMKMLDHVRMYTDSDYAEEFKEENGRYPTTEEVTDVLYDQNGDGCDLIYWIRNLTTGEMIFDGAIEESEPEEWDDDIDEMLTESEVFDDMQDNIEAALKTNDSLQFIIEPASNGVLIRFLEGDKESVLRAVDKLSKKGFDIGSAGQEFDFNFIVKGFTEQSDKQLAI